MKSRIKNFSLTVYVANMDFTAPFCDVSSTVNNCESEISNFNLKNSEKTLIEVSGRCQILILR